MRRQHLPHHWSFAVNIAKHLPADAGRPVEFAINGPDTIIITEARRCFIYRNGEQVIRERKLWEVVVCDNEHTDLT